VGRAASSRNNSALLPNRSRMPPSSMACRWRCLSAAGSCWSRPHPPSLHSVDPRWWRRRAALCRSRRPPRRRDSAYSQRLAVSRWTGRRSILSPDRAGNCLSVSGGTGCYAHEAISRSAVEGCHEMFQAAVMPKLKKGGVDRWATPGLAYLAAARQPSHLPEQRCPARSVHRRLATR
jgi:hypothetical protein